MEFFSLLKHTKGLQWAGEPLQLQPWQIFIVGSLFGWIHKKTGLRRFRTAYNEVGKKNGKSTFAAGLGLLLAFFDGEPGAEVYSVATARKQARLVWEQARDMVRGDRFLAKSIDVFVSNLSSKQTSSKFEPLSSDYGRTDGINPHGVIVDELHEHKNRGLWDVVKKSMINRSQPLLFAITTAGYDRHTVCWEQREYSISVLEGIYKDAGAESWFAFIATPDDEEDWKSDKAWKKANPNLGVTIDLGAFKKEFEEAKASPSRENAFKRYNLNIWTEQSERWIQIETWDACRVPRDAEDLVGKVSFGGLDLARTRDITAFVLVFPERMESGELEYDVYPWFWIPEEGLDERAKRDKVPFVDWVQQGYIETTPGPVTNYEWIEEKILQLASRYQIAEVGYDPWNATDLALRLERQGATMVEMRQGPVTMSAPTKEVERLTLKGVIRHGGNPVLRWMAGNVSVRRDPRDNILIDKSEPTKRVDGMVALAMAIGRSIVYHQEEDQPSVYEERGALVL